MTEQEAVQDAVNRYVLTEIGSDRHGSGVVLTTGFVLTSFHGLLAERGIKVSGKEAQIIAVDTKNDLTLLSVRTKKFAMMKLGSVSLAEQVFLVGNPNNLSGVLLFGRVGYVDKKQIAHDAHGTVGVSGSGLFNLKGELVGVNESVSGSSQGGSWLTIATPANRIMNILSKIPKTK